MLVGWYVSGADWCGIGGDGGWLMVVVVVVVAVYTILSWTGPACGGSPQLSAGWREENK